MSKKTDINSSTDNKLSTAEKWAIFINRDNHFESNPSNNNNNNNLIDKQNLFDILYWFRQFIGLIIGIVFGLVNIQGIQGFIAYILISCVIIYLYYSKYQYNIDEEEIGRFELLSEGFMPAIALFTLAWILTYSQQFNAISVIMK